jgi:hypothetical protein
MLVCTFVCANRTRDRGCSAHPVFPAPSVFEGEDFQQNSRNVCGEIENPCFAVIASEAKQSMGRHEERMDCFVGPVIFLVKLRDSLRALIWSA